MRAGRRGAKFSLVAVALFTISVPSWCAEVIIPSQRVDKISLDPQDAIWQKAETQTVPLSKQTMVSPHGGGSVNTLFAQSLYNQTEIAFRLRWKDATKDDIWDLTNRFTDACAIQFPIKPGALPSPFMGEKENPVNIWRWMAVAEAKERFPKAYSDFYRRDAIETTVKFPQQPGENLAAHGFGTIARRKIQDIEARGHWRDGEWVVVFKRKMGSKGGVRFKENSVLPVAFALWDGSNKERDGMKSVALWHWLIIGKAQVFKASNPVERGKIVFARYGCATCHGPEGKGGIKNPNSQGGEVPPINRVAEGFTEEELEKVILEGRIPQASDTRAPLPPLWMNAWASVMGEEELDHLTKYLFSLLPKEKRDEW